MVAIMAVASPMRLWTASVCVSLSAVCSGGLEVAGGGSLGTSFRPGGLEAGAGGGLCTCLGCGLLGTAAGFETGVNAIVCSWIVLDISAGCCVRCTGFFPHSS